MTPEIQALEAQADTSSTQPVAEPKPLRPRSEIVEDYKKICALIGDKTYRIKLLEAELHALYIQINQIDSEKPAPAVSEAVQAPQS